MIKLAKEIFRTNRNVRAYSSIQEKRISVDEMHKPYVRGKRNKNNLPDSWTYTRWISKPLNSSWKIKAKVRKQWEKYKKDFHELNLLYKNKAIKNNFIFMLTTKYPNDWYYFKFPVLPNGKLDVGNFYSCCTDYYLVSEDLVKDGILEAKFYTRTWTFYDFGKPIKQTRRYITAVRLKK